MEENILQENCEQLKKKYLKEKSFQGKWGCAKYFEFKRWNETQ